MARSFSLYGARYYDPRTSVWQSPDPILDKYMSGETNDGVFNPQNLSLFTYTYNNPVNLSDPDGMAPDSIIWSKILLENKQRHEHAVQLKIKQLKAKGYTNIQTEVRVKVNLPDGDTADRIMDIAASKTSKLSEGKFFEIKTFENKGSKSALPKQLKAIDNVLKVGKLLARGSTVKEQLNKDAALYSLGGTIQSTGEKVKGNAVNWAIFPYQKGKKPMRQKGTDIPVMTPKDIEFDIKIKTPWEK